MKYFDFECQKCGEFVDWSYDQDELCPDCLYNERMPEIEAQGVRMREKAQLVKEASERVCEKCGAPMEVLPGFDADGQPRTSFTCKCWRDSEGSRHTWGATSRYD